MKEYTFIFIGFVIGCAVTISTYILQPRKDAPTPKQTLFYKTDLSKQIDILSEESKRSIWMAPTTYRTDKYNQEVLKLLKQLVYNDSINHVKKKVSQ